MFEQSITNDISVEVQSMFLPEHSDRAENRFFFAYRVRIANRGTRTVQLLSRHWIITDGLGRIEEVRGAGVVGVQPKISAGETFEYESFCPLPTPTGMMRGSYEMTADDGGRFQVGIPQFYLVEPSSFH